MTDGKTRDNKLRRMAKRQDTTLMRSRLRDPHAYGFGTYMLLDAATNGIVHADHSTGRGHGLDLDDVAGFLTR